MGRLTSSSSGGRVNVVDGDNQLTVNPDGSIDVNTTPEAGTVETSYGEVTLVPQNTLVTVTSYIAGGPTRIKLAQTTGTNIAIFRVTVNGTTINKQLSFYGNLNTGFDFDKGYPINISDEVRVTAISQQPTDSEFSAMILFLKDY